MVKAKDFKLDKRVPRDSLDMSIENFFRNMGWTGSSDPTIFGHKVWTSNLAGTFPGNIQTLPLTRSSATAEKQRVSCACLPRLAN